MDNQNRGHLERERAAASRRAKIIQLRMFQLELARLEASENGKRPKRRNVSQPRKQK